MLRKRPKEGLGLTHFLRETKSQRLGQMPCSKLLVPPSLHVQMSVLVGPGFSDAFKATPTGFL